jgi:hypothetical protein
MKPGAKVLMILLFSVSVTLPCDGQCTKSGTACGQGVPHVVRFGGVLKNNAGAPHVGVVAIRFVIYGESTQGTPLWQEVQNVQLDQQGHYEVMLGATGSEGIPMELFTSGEQRWLGLQALLPGEEEQPRVLLVSVPYALEAADAQTLGGFPASAFARTGSTSASLNALSPDTAAANTTALAAGLGASAQTPLISQTAQAVTTPGGAANTLPKFSAQASIVNSQITETNGAVSMENLANILFADRFAGGVPAAVDACPANGCIIYAVSPNVNRNLGSIDPGFKAVTIYLGPYTYTVKQIMLRKALKIIGMGASGGTHLPTCSSTAPCNGTTLQSINGNNPVFVVPQANDAPATHVLLSGFQLLGSVGNTSEDGFFLDASSSLNSGLWYSTFDEISVSGFAGTGIHLRARNSDFLSADQWLLFNNVTVIRTRGGGNALRLEGSVFELRFRNCEFDGQAIGDGTNIYIGGFGGGLGGWPESIVFEGLISQLAGTAVQIDGTINLTFYGSHHEELWGAYLITNGTNIGTRGLTISDSYFAGNVGINGGSGYELNIATTSASGIFFVHNQMFANPDSVVKGTNIASVVYQDNLFCETCNGPTTSGITTQVSPATSISIRGVHSIGLNASPTPITTIQSGLGPGEMVTFFTLGGAVTFGAGGNIDLMGLSTLTVNGTITFVRSDLGGLSWKPVSQWSPSAVRAVQSQDGVGINERAQLSTAPGAGARSELALSRH